MDRRQHLGCLRVGSKWGDADWFGIPVSPNPQDQIGDTVFCNLALNIVSFFCCD